MQVWLFDIDGTLAVSHGAGKAAVNRSVNVVFDVPPDCGDIAFSGRTDRAIIGEIFRMHKIPRSDEHWQSFQTVYQQFLQEELDQRQGYVLPGVMQLLENLATRSDVSLGIVTGNVKAAAQIKLSHFKIDHFFQFGGFGDTHENRDNVAKEAYADACQTIGREIERDQVIVLGDTPNDIRCGKAIGAKTVAVTTGGFEKAELASHEPDLVLSDLTEIPTEF